MSIRPVQLKAIVEAALLAAEQPLTLERLMGLFNDSEVSADQIQGALIELTQDCAERGVEVKEVASGYRLQVKPELGQWIARLWEEKSPRYSRALLETLALVAYKQPLTRAEIEEVRGVAVSTHVVKTLMDREWVRVVGHRDVPGRPALYGTTRAFLDYFNLRSLDELPPLAEIRNLDDIHVSESMETTLQLALSVPSPAASESNVVRISRAPAEPDDTDEIRNGLDRPAAI